MRPYKLKHIPTGLYYQPHKHRGSHLSKKGKIYQSASNGLSYAFRRENETITVSCQKNSQIHKLTKDTLSWEECRWSYGQIRATTLTKDWVIEEI